MFPYRWLPRTIWPNIRYSLLSIKMGIGNFWTFRSAVWNFAAYDFSGLLDIMETAARAMRDGHAAHPITEDNDKMVRELTVLMECCRRLNDETYFQIAGYDSSTWASKSDEERTRIANHSEELHEQDVELLSNTMKNIRKWWS